MNYVYGFFQSCTFLIGALLELLIKQFLHQEMVSKLLNLQNGLFLGWSQGSDIEVRVNIDRIFREHTLVIGRTGSGKRETEFK